MRRAAALGLLLVLAGCSGGGGDAGPDGTGARGTQAPEPPSAEAQLGALLQRRARALQAGSARRYAATATGAQRARDRRAARNAARLPLRRVTLKARRIDVDGFHGALRAIDAAVATWLERLDPERDLLVLTADHGCDPTTPGTDHTREHVPLLASFAGHRGRRHDGPFADVGATVFAWLAGREADALPGTTFT